MEGERGKKGGRQKMWRELVDREGVGKRDRERDSLMRHIVK